MELSWELRRASWGHLGVHRNNEGGRNLPSPSRAIKIASRGALGALWGRYWALFGPSWRPLGPFLLGARLGHLGAIWRPQKCIRSEKARRPESL
eukprot:8704208-Pyramimonas_sp.AAC.1